MIDFKTTYRKYKIAEVLGEEFDDKEFSEILDHIKKTITNPYFKEFVDNKHHHRIRIGLSKDDIYIEYNQKFNYFWLSYDKTWTVFESRFGYNYQQIKDLTELVLSQQYKLKVVTAKPSKKAGSNVLSQQYKLKVVTAPSTYSSSFLS